MGVWMDGFMHGWMDGWVDGWMDGWMVCCSERGVPRKPSRMSERLSREHERVRGVDRATPAYAQYPKP